MNNANARLIGDICDIEKGISPTMKTLPGDYPLVVTAEFRRSSESYQFDTEAVCVPLVSSTGHGNAAIHRVHYQAGKFALANIMVALIPKNKDICDAKYLYYFLQAKKDQLLVPLMQGTANVSLKPQQIAGVKISLPSFEEQNRIVARIESAKALIEEISGLREAIQDDGKALLHSAFQNIIRNAEYRQLSEVAPIVRRPVNIVEDKEYIEFGVRSFHKGTFFKCVSSGLDIAHKKMFHVEPRDLVFSNIMAWEGAIAVAGEGDDGRIGVHRFIMCVPVEGVATSNFLDFYFQTQEGFQKIVEASPATIARNRTLSIKKLEKIEVPVPKYEMQNWFDSLKKKVSLIQSAQSEDQIELKALFPAYMAKAFIE